MHTKHKTSALITVMLLGLAAPTLALEPEEWFVRLTVETTLLEDAGNLLGRLEDSVDTWDVHDLPEIPPFAPPFLTIVFPHPEWGPNADDYATDYREARPGAGGTWDFEVRADFTYSVTLSWTGSGDLFDDILTRSILIDVESGDEIVPLPEGTYTTMMDDVTHRFTWRINSLAFVEAGPHIDFPPGGFLDLIATFSDEDEDDIHTASIDWGDGTVDIGIVDELARTIAGTHTYAPGVYTVEVCVEDEHGAGDCDSFEVGSQVFLDGFESGDCSAWSSGSC